MRRTLLLLCLAALVALALSRPRQEPSLGKEFDVKERCKNGREKVVGCEVRCLYDNGQVKVAGMDEKSVTCCKAVLPSYRSAACNDTVRSGGFYSGE